MAKRLYSIRNENADGSITLSRLGGDIGTDIDDFRTRLHALAPPPKARKKSRRSNFNAKGYIGTADGRLFKVYPFRTPRKANFVTRDRYVMRTSDGKLFNTSN